MPIWLRNYTFRKINDYYEQQAKAASQNKQTLGGDDTPKGPNIRKPTYTAKAPTK